MWVHWETNSSAATEMILRSNLAMWLTCLLNWGYLCWCYYTDPILWKAGANFNFFLIWYENRAYLEPCYKKKCKPWCFILEWKNKDSSWIIIRNKIVESEIYFFFKNCCMLNILRETVEDKWSSGKGIPAQIRNKIK